MILRISVSWTCTVVALLVAAPSHALSLLFDDVVVFGDSVVDAGNVFTVTGGTTPDPARGYSAGRFSNGPTAADVLHEAVTGSLSTASLLGGSNFAYGGARAIDDGDSTPDLAAQVDSHLAETGGVADPDAVYLINVGGNDVRDILLGADAGTRIQAVVTEIVMQVSALQLASAGQLVVAGVPDIGSLPETRAFGPAVQAAARSLSESLNAALFLALPSGVATVDAIALFDAVLSDPTAFGLPPGLNVTDACLGSGLPEPVGPPACAGYAFFDTIHPTAQVHEILGEAFIVAVPEPTTGALVALGLVALALRRR